MKTSVAVMVGLLCACAAFAAERQASVDDPSSGGKESLEAVYERVHTSVVTIRIVSRTGIVDEKGQVVSEGGVGSGVLISEDGKIMTAAHVVHAADRVAVEFTDGALHAARVVGSDPVADVALVQLLEEPPGGAVVAPLGDSDLVRVGAPVFVVGAPHGISHTLTVGHVSARRKSPRALGMAVKMEHFQTDASINKGNSGGPMFNMKGEVIGIVSYIISETGGSEGLGVAVTSNLCKELMLDIPPFWSGMEFIVLPGKFARIFNLPAGQIGILVQRVARDSPAHRIGLRGGSVPATIDGDPLLLGGDIVLEALGVQLKELDSIRLVRAKLDALEEEDSIHLVVLRGGERIELEDKRKILEGPP